MATRSPSRALAGAKAITTTAAKAVAKPATKAGTKSTTKRLRRTGATSPLTGKPGRRNAQRYTEWASFVAGGQSEFSYGAYFADSEPRS
jgi:hypothetical protein